jgi:lipoprotein-releasing system ATP-binding protein
VVGCDVTQPLVEARGIRKVFRTGEEDLEVLKNIDLQVASGEVLAIMGTSGVGKSTLLHILGTLDRPTVGTLSIDAVDVLALGEADLANFRNRHIGFVFQFHHLLPEFTALENVVLPVMISGRDAAQAKDEAAELLCRVGLDRRLSHRPGELSGGECQRVAMVRALVMRPLIVLADEPSGNLDAATSAELHDLIGELAQTYNQAFVIMTHDQNLADRADRTGYIEAGLLHL